MNKYWTRIYAESAIRYVLHGKVIKRCGSKCSMCGTSEFENGFEIHHLLPKCFGGRDIENNLTMLCVSCHKKAHGNGWKLRKYC